MAADESAPENHYKKIIFKEGGMYGNYNSFKDALKAIPETLPNLIKLARAENYI